jgi:imidazolonepropionase-like amidohydrolase
VRTASGVALLLVAALAVGAFALWRALAPPAPLAPAPQGATLENVTLVDPGVGRRRARTVVVEGGRIASIGAAGGAGEGNEPYAGMYVLPGLIEMHGHLPPAAGLPQADLFALLYLLHGVTAVRDMGDLDGSALGPAREGLESGAFAGPRLFACGPFVDGEPPAWPNSRVVRTPREAEAAVAEIAASGFHCVKVYDGLTPAALAAVRAAADRHGLPVVGHVPHRVSYAESGLDDVQHFTRAPTFDRVDPRPFPEVMDAWLEVDDARIAQIVAHALATGIANTPTLVTTERLAHMDRYERLRAAPEARLLPRFYRDVIWSPRAGLGLRLGPGDLENLRVAVERAKRLVARLHDAGARLHVGSDVMTNFVVPGAGLQREIRLFVEAGLTPEEALALATRGNGASLPLDRLGRLEPGAPADLVVFREDPTRSLDALATLEAVVADGRLYAREDLEAQLARQRRHFEGAVFDAVSVYVTRRMLERMFPAE